MRSFDAVIFDMDGVIFDSERKVIECWQEVAARRGIPEIEPVLERCLGVNADSSRVIMKERYGQDFPYDDCAREASRIFHGRYDGGRLPLKPGVEPLLRALKERGKRVALASSTRRQSVEQELRDAGLLRWFDALVCGDMVKRSKPAPDIFLTACAEIGTAPADAYAVEDSWNGIRSAAAGGLRAIMVPDLMPATAEMEALTETVLPDLEAARLYLLGE